MEVDKNPGFVEYLGAVRRRRWLAVSVATAVVLFAAILAFALPNQYSSTAVFQLRDTDESEGRGNSYADRYVSALTEAVLTSDNRKAALAKVEPYPELQDDPSAAQQQLGQDVSVQMVVEKILDPGSGRERNINTGFTVSYANRDPATAKLGAEWFADAFLRVSRSDAARRVTNEGKFFASEAERTRARIDELEAQLADFKRSNFQQLPESAQTNMTVRNQSEQELESVERELRTLQQNRIFLMQQLQAARNASPDSNALFQLQDQYQRKGAIYDENHPDMIALRTQIESLKRGEKISGDSLPAQLRTQRAILEQTRQRYSDEHPDVVRLKREIGLLESRISNGERTAAVDDTSRTPVVVQLETQMNATDTQLVALQARSSELRLKLRDLDQRLSSTPQVERQYEVLTRDLGAAREQYAQLASKKMESDVKAAGIAAGTADRFRLVKPPSEPNDPSQPKRGAILLLGFIGAIALAFMAILAAEILDTTVRGSRDVRGLLGHSPLAVIPDIRNSESRRIRTRHITAYATSVLIGVPIVYFAVRLMVQ